MEVKVSELTARTALNPSRLAGYAYTLNPYRGCTFGCRYCYSPAVLHLARSRWAHHIGVKRNLPSVLAAELKRLEAPTREAEPWVVISTVTDGYQPLEARFKVTRRCLEQLARYDWPVSILTKSHLFQRDLDLLGKLSRAEVGLSLTTTDQARQKIIEPGVGPVQVRLEALALAAEAGISTYCFLGPLYPDQDAHELERLIHQIAASGAREVLVDDLHLRDGVWEALKAGIGPETVEAWWEPLHDGGKTYRELFAVARRACHQEGLGFRLSELSRV